MQSRFIEIIPSSKPTPTLSFLNASVSKNGLNPVMPPNSSSLLDLFKMWLISMMFGILIVKKEISYQARMLNEWFARVEY